MLRNPLVRTILCPSNRSDAIPAREPRPAATKFSQDTIDRGGACKRTIARVNDPQLAVCLGPSELESLPQPRRLTWQGQHTAGMVARSNPARTPCSKASCTVEQHDDAFRLKHRGVQPLPIVVIHTREIYPPLNLTLARDRLEYDSRTVSPVTQT